MAPARLVSDPHVTDPIGRLVDIVLDCADAKTLAAFWCQVLGLRVLQRETDWITAERGGQSMSFSRW